MKQLSKNNALTDVITKKKFFDPISFNMRIAHYIYIVYKN